MKKIIALVLAAMMLVGMLAACGGGDNETTAPKETTAPAATKSYQFYGKFEESGGFSAFLNASILMIMISMFALVANWRTSDSLAEL